MTASPASDTTGVEAPSTVSTGLRAGSVGLVGVLFMAVANAAPITALSFNVPIAVGFGNGAGAPAGFLFATIVLTLFTVGYVAMGRYITTAGAFYGFITQGLGQIWGMASGLLATVAYVIFEGSLIGGFAYFGRDAVKSSFGVDINWVVWAIVGAVAIGILCHFAVTLTAAVLSVTLVAEVLLLTALGISVLFKGGPDGFLFSQTVPIVPAFKDLAAGAYGTTAASGVAALGVFFAFWSWVGYETTAVYGEESKDPKRIVPRATLIAVVGLGLFYTFMSWMVIVGQGPKKAVAYSLSASPVDLWLTLVDANLGGFATGLYRVLVVVGSFACAMAFHNAASRYLFALGREVPFAKVRATLGTAHPRHQSPHVANAAQTVVTLLILGAFALFGAVHIPDASGKLVSTPEMVPYVLIYGVLALVGTAMVLIIQVICSVAVVWYFLVKKAHSDSFFWTKAAPIIGLVGGVGMVYALWLLWQNRAFAAGYGSDSPVFQLAPYYVPGIFVIGLVYAVWVRVKHPQTYAEIASATRAEAHER